MARAGAGLVVLWATLSGLASAADGEEARREAEKLWQGGDRPGALQRVDRALGAHPADPALRFLRGVLLEASGRDAEAELIYVELSRDHPEMAEPLNNLAVLRAARGDLDGARSLLEDALRRDPAYAIAQENLGDVLLRQAERAYEAAGRSPRARPGLQRKLAALKSIPAAPVR